MPERNCSAIRDEVKKPRAKTTNSNGGTRAKIGKIFGTTWYHRKICTSSGMLRNSSTQPLPKRTSQGLFGSVRITPTIEPITRATTSEQSDTATVQPQAETSHCQYVGILPPGSCRNT